MDSEPNPSYVKQDSPLDVSEVVKYFGREADKPALNVGSGPLPFGGWVNLERFKNAGERDQTKGSVEPPDVWGDAHDLPFKQNTFETVYFRHVLEHFIFPLRALWEARRVLKPGGLVRVEVPNALRCEEEKDTHLYSWTPDSLQQIVSYAGFESVTYINYESKHPPYEQVPGNNHGVEAFAP